MRTRKLMAWVRNSGVTNAGDPTAWVRWTLHLGRFSVRWTDGLEWVISVNWNGRTLLFASRDVHPLVWRALVPVAEAKETEWQRREDERDDDDPLGRAS